MIPNRMIRTSLLVAGTFFVFIPILAMAEDASQAAPGKATPWTPGDILSAESASQWKISPDGKWAVETKKEVQLTRGSEIQGQPEWSPGGEPETKPE